MKKLYLLTFCATMLFVASCTKDSTESGSSSGGEDLSRYTVLTPADKWDGEKRSATTYQLLVYSFADSNGDGVGDFRGIIDKLDYIEALGATALWLSPIHPADSYHGYDVIDYDAVNPDYGTMADFEELVAKSHERGIKIYLDFVLNHTGKSHPWFLDAVRGEESPYRDYYIFSTNPESDVKAGKIAMLTDKNYVESEWRDSPTSEDSASSARLKFSLQWGDRPTITVTETTIVDDENPDTSTNGAKYLYFGNGTCLKFYDKGGDLYELSVDFRSSWGFLVRTSNTTWDGGTKYGAPEGAGGLSLGKPFTLTNSGNPANIVPDWITIWKFHSNFNTDYMPDLNYGAISDFRNSRPYQEMIASAKGWIERGVDGFRLDAVKHIYHNSSSTENPTFLDAYYTELNDYFQSKNSGRRLYMVGEVFGGANEVAQYYRGLPALFEFDFWWRLADKIIAGRGNDFCSTILSYQPKYAQYRADYIEPIKLSNHDEARTRGRIGGEEARARLAGAVLLTAAGEPYIYYGEELGFYGDKDKYGDNHARTPMRWSDNYTTTMMKRYEDSEQASVKSVIQQGADNGSILNMYRSLSRMRHAYKSMAVGKMVPHEVYNEKNRDFTQIAAWYRVADDERALVLHNFSDKEVDVPFEDKVDECIGQQGGVMYRIRNGVQSVRMPRYSSVVFKLK